MSYSSELKKLQEESWELAGWVAEQGLKQLRGEPVDTYVLKVLEGFRSRKTVQSSVTQQVVTKKWRSIPEEIKIEPIHKLNIQNGLHNEVAEVKVLKFVPETSSPEVNPVENARPAAVKRSTSSMELELVKVRGKSENRFYYPQYNEPQTICVTAVDNYVDQFDHIAPGKKYIVTGLTNDNNDAEKYKIRAGTSFTLIEPL